MERAFLLSQQEFTAEAAESAEKWRGTVPNLSAWSNTRVLNASY
jgi:hypothetical protein